MAAQKRPPAARSSWSRLFEPVDIASLVYFRIAFAAILLWEGFRYFNNNWIEDLFIKPAFHFSYFGFEWVELPPGNGLYFVFAGLGVLLLCILIGLGYRVATALFFLGYCYVVLQEEALYLNHFYLIGILILMLVFVPAPRAFSVAARRRPGQRSQTAPAWTLWMLRVQIGIVYFFGGVAKLNADWLAGEPMRKWLAAETGFPLIGRFFTEEWMVYGFVWGGLALDLFIVPAMLWKRTRIPAFAGVTLFHLMNSQLFGIGIFPWLMIAANLLFLPPDWPRRLVGRARQPSGKPARQRPAASALTTGQRVTVALLCAHFAIQVLLPLRHHLYPGNVSWTEEGHRLAWHMKLRDKAGRVIYHVHELSSGETWDVDPARSLKVWQLPKANVHPDMILQFAHRIGRELQKSGRFPVEVRVTAMVSLNGREPQLLIDPTVDLLRQERSLRRATWIKPLKK